MYITVQKILETFLFEKKTLTKEEVEKIIPLPKEKLPIFITLYDGDNIIASAGKIYPSHETFAEELIDNTLLLLSDERFKEYIENPEKIRKIEYRVDIYRESDRRILHHPDELAGSVEGMILLCQKQEKAGIILPHMMKGIPSGEEMYRQLTQKIHLDLSHIGKWDIILYAVKTEIFGKTPE